MPTSLPHAGVEENKRVLQQLDMAAATVPEIQTVVGKAGRTESALDPAPISMYENIIQYRSEYEKNDAGSPQRFKVNADGYFELSNGKVLANPNLEVSNKQNYAENHVSEPLRIDRSLLIHDTDGEYFRNWRPEIKNPDDIWNEIVKVTKLPGSLPHQNCNPLKRVW